MKSIDNIVNIKSVSDGELAESSKCWAKWLVAAHLLRTGVDVINYTSPRNSWPCTEIWNLCYHKSRWWWTGKFFSTPREMLIGNSLVYKFLIQILQVWILLSPFHDQGINPSIDIPISLFCWLFAKTLDHKFGEMAKSLAHRGKCLATFLPTWRFKLKFSLVP